MGDQAFDGYVIGLYALCSLYLVTVLTTRTTQGRVQEAVWLLAMFQWAALTTCWLYRWWQVLHGGDW